MKTVEHGKPDGETIMLLHGGGLSWWNFKKEAELLGDRYRVVLPVLDGHAESDADFVSIEENAKRIISHIDRECGGSVLLLGGLSLGAQVLVEVLSEREGVCRFAVVESASVMPSKLTNALVGPAVSSTCGLVQRRWFARMQSKSLRIGDDLFDEYYRDSRRISKRNLIAFLKASTTYFPKETLRRNCAEVRIVVGEREQKRMRRSASLLQGMMPKGTLEIKKGLRHGEYSINNPELYVDELVSMLAA